MAPPASTVCCVPSSQLIAQVCVSLLPGSVNRTVVDTGSPTRKSCHGWGVWTPVPPDGWDRARGATLRRDTVAPALTDGLTPSLAVSVMVNVPSSVHVTWVVARSGSEKEHDAPGSVSGP